MFYQTGIVKSRSLIFLVSVSIINTCCISFSFLALPQKRKKKTLGKNHSTYPQIQPTPQDSCRPAGGLPGLRAG